MIVSWNWLKQYVRLDMSCDELGNRLMMAGLNLESISDVDGDIAIDLEVTSNRGDCLGHLGVAREVSALYGHPVIMPAATPAESGPQIDSKVRLFNEDLEHCPQYFARLISGVTIRESPAWMQQRLRTLGVRPINNVVDCTNYVLFECGQPLHAFDFDLLHGGMIRIRKSTAGETITAIDQRKYSLPADCCVIADEDRAIAVAGVMGGLDTEINTGTKTVLLEAAEFTAMSVRGTARALGLHSDSSYRFERGLDRQNVEWASRRCAELILQTAGGELATGYLLAGAVPEPPRTPVALRFSQLKRILGIDIPAETAVGILQRLGLQLAGRDGAVQAEFIAPSYRRDLTREIDLVEEVARIHGYENIPETAIVPLDVSTVPDRDRVIQRCSRALVGAGFHETMTLSFVTSELTAAVSPWTTQPPLAVSHSSRRHESALRQSLLPSLLTVRRQNERFGAAGAELFEIARVFLGIRPGDMTAEPTVLGVVSSRGVTELTGVMQRVADQVNHRAVVSAVPFEAGYLVPGRGAKLLLNGKPWGFLGELSVESRKFFELDQTATIAEVDLAVLEPLLVQWPEVQALPQFPGIERDLNFVLDESTTWQELADVVQASAGKTFVNLQFVDQYRGQQIAAGKKSYVIRLEFRSADRTLTTAEVDSAVSAVVESATGRLQATLR